MGFNFGKEEFGEIRLNGFVSLVSVWTNHKTRKDVKWRKKSKGKKLENQGLPTFSCLHLSKPVFSTNEQMWSINRVVFTENIYECKHNKVSNLISVFI